MVVLVKSEVISRKSWVYARDFCVLLADKNEGKENKKLCHFDERNEHCDRARRNLLQHASRTCTANMHSE